MANEKQKTAEPAGTISERAAVTHDPALNDTVETLYTAYPVPAPVLTPEQLARIVNDETEQLERTEGQKLANYIATSHYMPAPDQPGRNWAQVHVANQAPGTYVKCGSLEGTVTRIERRTNQLMRAGKVENVESIWLYGGFNAVIENPATGEVRTLTSSAAILPKVFGEMIASAISGGGRATFDVDIGLEATGRNIPYAWAVVSYLENPETKRLRKLPPRLGPGQQVPRQPAPKQISNGTAAN